MIIAGLFALAFTCFLRDSLIVIGIFVFAIAYFFLVGASIASDISETAARVITGWVVLGFVFVFARRKRRRRSDRS